jgi:hypothetical protein
MDTGVVVSLITLAALFVFALAALAAVLIWSLRYLVSSLDKQQVRYLEDKRLSRAFIAATFNHNDESTNVNVALVNKETHMG